MPCTVLVRSSGQAAPRMLRLPQQVESSTARHTPLPKDSPQYPYCTLARELTGPEKQGFCVQCVGPTEQVILMGNDQDNRCLLVRPGDNQWAQAGL